MAGGWHVPRIAVNPALVLLSMFVTVASGGCASSNTCPLHASDSLKSCYFKSINQMWTPNAAGPVHMPGEGLYSFAKVSKDESNCCYDLNVQAYMCEAQRRNGDKVIFVAPLGRCPQRRARAQATRLDLHLEPRALRCACARRLMVQSW